jgi:hypothetical protein
MAFGVAVDFARAGLENPGAEPFGHSEHVEGAQQGSLHRLDGIALISGRRGGAGQVEDPINVLVDWLGNIVPADFEARICRQMSDVFVASRLEVVQADHSATPAEQPVAQVRTQKTGAARHQDSFVHPETLPREPDAAPRRFVDHAASERLTWWSPMPRDEARMKATISATSGTLENSASILSRACGTVKPLR